MPLSKRLLFVTNNDDSGIERGQYNLTLSTLTRMAKGSGMPLSELFANVGPRPRSTSKEYRREESAASPPERTDNLDSVQICANSSATRGLDRSESAGRRENRPRFTEAGYSWLSSREA
jgi:hypothetical protein